MSSCSQAQPRTQCLCLGQAQALTGTSQCGRAAVTTLFEREDSPTACWSDRVASGSPRLMTGDARHSPSILTADRNKQASRRRIKNLTVKTSTNGVRDSL